MWMALRSEPVGSSGQSHEGPAPTQVRRSCKAREHAPGAVFCRLQRAGRPGDSGEERQAAGLGGRSHSSPGDFSTLVSWPPGPGTGWGRSRRLDLVPRSGCPRPPERPRPRHSQGHVGAALAPALLFRVALPSPLALISAPLGLARLGGLLLRRLRMGLRDSPCLYRSPDLASCLLRCRHRTPLGPRGRGRKKKVALGDSGEGSAAGGSSAMRWDGSCRGQPSHVRTEQGGRGRGAGVSALGGRSWSHSRLYHFFPRKP